MQPPGSCYFVKFGHWLAGFIALSHSYPCSGMKGLWVAREGAMVALLDPKNDYVFKRLFAGDPELTVALINDLRPDVPRMASVVTGSTSSNTGRRTPSRQILPTSLS